MNVYHTVELSTKLNENATLEKTPQMQKVTQGLLLHPYLSRLNRVNDRDNQTYLV